ncbi:SIR2 [Candida pseudojiufengensis]|uniref:SIR2 n=1 Tax=Candida pseudojiufengensis TaxID=497109 RepID=UPI0022252D2F|nr:SIR2 [Candida pseudojiufengensis]KAI5960659.1 SIR2 [Candida pseudojiufengensis]
MISSQNTYSGNSSMSVLALSKTPPTIVKELESEFIDGFELSRNDGCLSWKVPANSVAVVKPLKLNEARFSMLSQNSSKKSKTANPRPINALNYINNGTKGNEVENSEIQNRNNRIYQQTPAINRTNVPVSHRVNQATVPQRSPNFSNGRINIGSFYRPKAFSKIQKNTKKFRVSDTTMKEIFKPTAASSAPSSVQNINKFRLSDENFSKIFENISSTATLMTENSSQAPPVNNTTGDFNLQPITPSKNIAFNIQPANQPILGNVVDIDVAPRDQTHSKSQEVSGHATIDMTSNLPHEASLLNLTSRDLPQTQASESTSAPTSHHSLNFPHEASHLNLSTKNLPQTQALESMSAHPSHDSAIPAQNTSLENTITIDDEFDLDAINFDFDKPDQKIDLNEFTLPELSIVPQVIESQECSQEPERITESQEYSPEPERIRSPPFSTVQPRQEEIREVQESKSNVPNNQEIESLFKESNSNSKDVSPTISPTRSINDTIPLISLSTHLKSKEEYTDHSNQLHISPDTSVSESESEELSLMDASAQRIKEMESEVLSDDYIENFVADKKLRKRYKDKLRVKGVAGFLEKHLSDSMTKFDICNLILNLGYPKAAIKDHKSQTIDELAGILIKLLMWDEKGDLLSVTKAFEQQYFLDDFVEDLKTKSKIMVITGAGISTSLGIPDFRSNEGLYSKLESLNLSDPQMVFDLMTFRLDPSIFYSVAHMILPPDEKLSLFHCFIRLLQDKNKLRRLYTQNVDNLESAAGINETKLVQCHGSFANATCITCKNKINGKRIHDSIRGGLIPRCFQCWRNIENAPFNHGVYKPDITFFGEDLPEKFYSCLSKDAIDCDLVIVVGSSLKVEPVSSMIDQIPKNVKKVLINKDPIPDKNFDLSLLGYCDDITAYLLKTLGSDWFLDHKDFSEHFNYKIVETRDRVIKVSKC